MVLTNIVGKILFDLLMITSMYILASAFFEKDDTQVFKARNSCFVYGILAFKKYLLSFSNQLIRPI